MSTPDLLTLADRLLTTGVLRFSVGPLVEGQCPYTIEFGGGNMNPEFARDLGTALGEVLFAQEKRFRSAWLGSILMYNWDLQLSHAMNRVAERRAPEPFVEGEGDGSEHVVVVGMEFDPKGYGATLAHLREKNKFDLHRVAVVILENDGPSRLLPIENFSLTPLFTMRDLAHHFRASDAITISQYNAVITWLDGLAHS